jgi:hypothetical protein
MQELAHFGVWIGDSPAPPATCQRSAYLRARPLLVMRKAKTLELRASRGAPMQRSGGRMRTAPARASTPTCRDGTSNGQVNGAPVAAVSCAGRKPASAPHGVGCAPGSGAGRLTSRGREVRLRPDALRMHSPPPWRLVAKRSWPHARECVASLVVLLCLAACGARRAEKSCHTPRVAQAIVGGTATESLLGLGPEARAALVYLRGTVAGEPALCSGVLVAQRCTATRPRRPDLRGELQNSVAPQRTHPQPTMPTPTQATRSRVEP